MPVSSIHWRLVVGFFNRARNKETSKLSARISPITILIFLQYASIMFLSSINFFIYTLIILCGDVKQNPGPRKRGQKSDFSVSYWNVNSLLAHSFAKIDSFIAYNAIHNYDVICFSETFLDSSFTSEDTNLAINGYRLYRADHPSNTKKGGVCIFVKESIAIRLLD